MVRLPVQEASNGLALDVKMSAALRNPMNPSTRRCVTGPPPALRGPGESFPDRSSLNGRTSPTNPLPGPDHIYLRVMPVYGESEVDHSSLALSLLLAIVPVSV